MKPTDVLGLRRQLLAEYAPRARYPRPSMAAVAGKVHGALASGCQAFYVTADMLSVAQAAAPSMPRQELLHGDEPATRGIMLYDGVLPLPAYSSYRPEVIGFLWNADVQVAPTGADRWREASAVPEGERVPGVRIMPITRHPRHGGKIIVSSLADNPTECAWNETPAHDPWRLTPILLATWTIMQQTLAIRDVERVTPGKAKGKRGPATPQTVVIVRLRKRERGENADGAGHEVEWSHRWLVAGHWRNQWLPSRGMHRQQWIDGYVKGPEDKPLVVKDRVQAWVQ